MYWYVKVFIACVAVLVLGGIVFQFRSYLPSFASIVDKPNTLVVSDKKEAPRHPISVTTDISESNKPEEKNSKNSRFRHKFNKAKELFDQNELIKSRKIAENILLDPDLVDYGEIWFTTTDLISEINTILLFSDAPCPEKVMYTVVPGDNLIKIAKKFNTTVGLIQRSNFQDETNPRIYPNQVFQIYKGSWNIKVVKSLYLLIVQDGDRITKTYKVGIGKQDRTPVGTFKIDLKDFEPDWWRPGKMVEFGDPENVLGTRWMGISPTRNTNKQLKGYGIHGTWEPNSIGHAASQGCIRMVNEDVEELYEIVSVGTPVTIIE